MEATLARVEAEAEATLEARRREAEAMLEAQRSEAEAMHEVVFDAAAPAAVGATAEAAAAVAESKRAHC